MGLPRPVTGLLYLYLLLSFFDILRYLSKYDLINLFALPEIP